MKRICIFILLLATAMPSFAQSLNNTKVNGYKGIWFTLGQFSEYGDKYSGGLSTYTAKHIPLAIYAPEVQKTFFVYGGIAEGRKSDADAPGYARKDYGNYLLCMAGCYDHRSNTVSKPVVVHDKNGVFDPHDNPSIAMDAEGYIWVFVSGRNTARLGAKYRSVKPYSIDEFEKIREDEITYPQPKYVAGKGFLHLFTKYTGTRLLYFNTSTDGITWTEDQQLAAIKRKGDQNGGHYQISGQLGEKIAFFFNWHPNGNVDQRTNIYYLQTVDFGKTWTTVDGKPVRIPVTDLNSTTLVKEFFSKGENVYIKDMAFDEKGYPVALYLYGKGHQPGPENGLKQWCVAHWNGKGWEHHSITTSDHNYDTGSIWVDATRWTVVAPTENSPQEWGGGGELVMWESADLGKTWTRAKQITSNSPRNHNYVRKVVNGADPFMYFWADGNPHKPSRSLMYFGDSRGNVHALPYTMEKETAVCAVVPQWPSNIRKIDIAPVPSSFPVGFGLYTHGDRQFVTFYDTAHYMTIASRTLDSEIWDYQRLDSKVGWDSHNSVIVKIDARGYIHVVGNMHASTLVYFRSTKPLDIHSMQRIPQMTGKNEDRTTYPIFMDGPNGEFIFHYRDGGSGNGNEIYNVCDVDWQVWTPLLDKPLTDGKGERNAYMQGPVAGPDGFFHLIWVWRETPDCATNHALSYTRSKDLIHWESIGAKSVALPIVLENKELYVDDTPPGGGLFNPGIRLGFDHSGKVLIGYHKYDGKKNTQMYIARYENGKWVSRQVTDWDFPWNFQGNGSIEVELTIDAPKPLPGGEISFGYHRKGVGDKVVVLDGKTLNPLREQAYSYSYPEILDIVESPFPGMMVNKRFDSGKPANANESYLLCWETLPPNRDRKRTGDIPEASMLRLYQINKK